MSPLKICEQHQPENHQFRQASRFANINLGKMETAAEATS